MWQELDLFNLCEWRDPEDGVLYQNIVARERVYDFLAGLNRELDEVGGRILGLKPLPSIDEVFAEVRREENRRSVMLAESPSNLAPENSALVARGPDTHGANRSKKNQSWCDHCQKPYHKKNQSWCDHWFLV